jgi:pimeloyl-ACP methyl ester carboxylesterase
MMMKTNLGVLSLSVILLVACADEENPSLLGPDASGGRATSGVAQAIEGEVGGSRYGLFLPAEWNGELVIYAHGFRDVGTPVDLRDQDGFYALRDQLLSQGYGIGYSSFPENGLAVKEGAQRTRQVEAKFTAEFARPDRTYLVGHSLGGVIGLMLAETHPNRYAGVLPVCAQVGGIQAAADYFGHVRVLFDYFYPNVLPGDALTIPAGVDVTSQVIVPAVGAIQSDLGAGAGAMARILAQQGMPIPASNATELVQSIVAALVFGFRAVPDLLDRTNGHSPFDNSTVVYFSPAVPQVVLDDLNQKVDRFTSRPDATGYLSRYYQPTGEIDIPALTLSNTLDPISTPFHEPAYAAAVGAAGQLDNLVQRRSVNLYGHCNISPAEVVQAFTDLAAWSRSGVKPAA